MNQAPNPESYEFFHATWQVYRKIVDGNYMYHREIFTEILNTLRADIHAQCSILDLGCGDGGTMKPILAQLPLSTYLGIDASKPAIEIARSELERFGDRIELQCIDMLDFLRTMSSKVYDVIVVSFSLHHLDNAQKREFLSLSRSRLSPRGILVIADVFREEEQTREDYLNAYCHDMANRWNTLTQKELETAIEHVRAHDFPESEESFVNIAQSSGLSFKGRRIRHGYHAILIFGSGLTY